MKKQQNHKAPPFIRVGGRKAPPSPATPKQASPATLDLQMVERLLTTIIRKELQVMKKEILQEISNNPVQVVTQAASKETKPSTPEPTQIWEDEEEPIYIPSDITSSGKVSGTMSVESIGTDSSVTDATAALRAMKKNRRKK